MQVDGANVLVTGASSGIGAALAPMLAERYRVVCPDLRGAGWTVAESPGIERETRMHAAAGVDVFNVTHFGRRATARQQVVLDWSGVQCTRQGCGATRHLQVDHRIDWAHTHLTELRALDWLCVPCHRRKTHQGWALVDGTGRRPMVPPDDPAHPKNANAPPESAAA